MPLLPCHHAPLQDVSAPAAPVLAVCPPVVQAPRTSVSPPGARCPCSIGWLDRTALPGMTAGSNCGMLTPMMLDRDRTVSVALRVACRVLLLTPRHHSDRHATKCFPGF